VDDTYVKVSGRWRDVYRSRATKFGKSSTYSSPHGGMPGGDDGSLQAIGATLVGAVKFTTDHAPVYFGVC
jgi:hypothetical protein